jgi:hypothetical protein
MIERSNQFVCRRSAIIALVSMTLILTAIAHPVFASDVGNNNTWITATSAECTDSYYPAELNVAWDTVTPVTSSLDGQGASGSWTWQVNIQTAQYASSSSGDVYQYVTYVSSYALAQPSVWVLLNGGGSNRNNYKEEVNGFFYGDYYVGGTDGESNIEVEADSSYSDDLLSSVEFHVWDNGVLEPEPVTIDVPYQYGATPESYQNVLVSTPGDTGLNFYGGSGYFYTFGSQVQEIGCTPSWSTVENSTMTYSSWPSACYDDDTECYQDYSAPDNSAASVTVESEQEGGGQIYGYFQQLYSGTTQVATGYTTVTFSGLGADDSYSIYANSYGSCTFANWLIGTTNEGGNPYQFTATGSTDFTLIAVYDCS